jgi:hypothetical protein
MEGDHNFYESINHLMTSNGQSYQYLYKRRVVWQIFDISLISLHLKFEMHVKVSPFPLTS